MDVGGAICGGEESSRHIEGLLRVCAIDVEVSVDK